MLTLEGSAYSYDLPQLRNYSQEKLALIGVVVGNNHLFSWGGREPTTYAFFPQKTLAGGRNRYSVLRNVGENRPSYRSWA
jgi:hypothetical protein